MTHSLMNIHDMHSHPALAVKGDEERLIPHVCRRNSLTSVILLWFEFTAC